MKKCPNCGNAIADDATFCNACSAQVSVPMQTSQVAPAMSKEDLKVAKANYKQARKAAGKSRKSLAIGVIVVIIVVAVAAAGLTWYFMVQQQTQQTSVPVQEETSSDQEETSSGNVKTEATSNALYARYIGTWEGSFVSTESFGVLNAKDRCYAASDNDMVLVIDSISPDKRIEASAKVIYHGHDVTDKQGDKKTVSGDAYMTFDKLVGTFDPSGFTFTAQTSSEYHTSENDKIVIEVKPTQEGSSDVFDVTVTSYFDLRNPRLYQVVNTVDTYTLHKK